jgi:hypothetical protein
MIPTAGPREKGRTADPMNFTAPPSVARVDFGLPGVPMRGDTRVKKVTVVAVGGLLVLFGVTFGLQGLGVIGGSAMSGKNSWAVIGPLLALVGVVLLVRGLRGSKPTG